MKKVLAMIIVVVLILQAGAVTAFAANAEENEQVITISNIRFTKTSSSTEITTAGLPNYAIEIVGEEWSCPDEISFSGENIEITGGTYSYKLTLRSNKTLTFDNDLEILYQGINGKYQLNYEIDETDNHIMIVTGTFENIIIESPLMEQLSDKSKEWIISHITEDSYYYKLLLRTAEGFSFTNRLRFLFDTKPTGFSLDYVYDLLTDDHSLVINGISDCSEAGEESQEAGQAREFVLLDFGKRIAALLGIENADSFTKTFAKVKEALKNLFNLNDIDGDGDVTSVDVTWIQRCLACINVPEYVNKAAGDADGDGEVTVFDATWYQCCLAEMDVD